MATDYRYLTVNQLSKITGKDRQTINKRLSEVVPVKEDKRGKYYDSWECLSIIYAADKKEGMSQQIEQVSLQIEKERLQKLRIDNDKSLGQLVDIDQVVGIVEKEYTYIKAKFLSLNVRLAKILALESDPQKVSDTIYESVQEILEELKADNTFNEQQQEIENSGSTR